jgi:NAD(P)-dependent dehydrogenase (short-subunit alcohol dehydrogenase family)
MAARGWLVLAGVRRAGDAPPGTTEVILDVTDPDAVAALGETATVAGGLSVGLDGLVDNAGIGISAPLENLPLDELRRQLEVNVVGQLAVTQAVLPALRAARGRIVIMGSIGGRSALPFLGGYAMTKHALEAMADSFRVELAPDGIEVSIVEPGTIATAIWTKPQPLADGVSDRYRARIDRFRRFAAARSSKAAPVDLVADAVEHALTAQRPKTRYVVGRDARIRATIERLPDRLRDRVYRRALLGE